MGRLPGRCVRVEAGACRLVSLNGNAFKSFPGLCQALAATIGNRTVILDGEIVALDAAGCAQFNPLLYRRAEPYYYAFDCLRGLPLVERKAVLRMLVPPQPARLLCVDHIVQKERSFADKIVSMPCPEYETIMKEWGPAVRRFDVSLAPPSTSRRAAKKRFDEEDHATRDLNAIESRRNRHVAACPVCKAEGLKPDFNSTARHHR